MEPVSETQIRLLKQYALDSNPQNHEEAHALICSLEGRILNAVEDTFDQRAGIGSKVFGIMCEALKRVDFLCDLPESGRLEQDLRERVAALAQQTLPEDLFATLRVKGRAKNRRKESPAATEESFFKCPCMNCLNNIEFPTHGVGLVIDCPHCSQPTELYDNNVLLPEVCEPSLDRIKVRSSNGSDSYYVSLIQYTCTCPDFIQTRSHAAPRHVFRVCKHMSYALKQMHDQLSPLLKSIISGDHGVPPGEFRTDRNNNPVYVTRLNDQGWINIFAPKRAAAKTYYSFGYNPREKRWAYGEQPLMDVADVEESDSNHELKDHLTRPSWVSRTQN